MEKNIKMKNILKTLIVGILVLSFILVTADAVGDIYSFINTDPDLNTTIENSYVDEKGFMHVNYTFEGIEKEGTYLSLELYEKFDYNETIDGKDVEQAWINFIQKQIDINTYSNVGVETKRSYWINEVGVDIEEDEDPWNKVVIGLNDKIKYLEENCIIK